MRKITLLLILAAAQAKGNQFQYPSNCARPNTIQSISGPPPPLPRLPERFQTGVEANLISRETTESATEFYDGPGNRAAIFVTMNNTENFLVFDYTNSQLFAIRDGRCTVNDLRFDLNQVLFGMKQDAGGIPHIYSTNDALHFSKRIGLTYMGKTRVRGISVDHWQSCLSWNMLASNFTLDYYFTVYNWTDSVLYPQLPVRAEVKGVQNVLTAKYFHHIYEYFDFKPVLDTWDDETVFQTPKGVVCPGRKQTKTVPTFPNQINYRYEMVAPEQQQVTLTDVWYDYTNKLDRFDFKPSYSAYPYYTTNLFTVIHDFVSGLAYVTDRSLGNCSIVPIQNTSFDIKLLNSSGSKDTPFRMRSTSELFYITKDSWSYVGQRPARGILSDVFISRTTDFKISGMNPFNTTFELYVSANSWKLSNLGASIGKTTGVPVRLDVTSDSWQVGLRFSYNIYNFNSQKPPADTFDVSSCYDEFSKLSFTLEFSGSYDNTMQQYKNYLLLEVSDQILRKTMLSRLRLQNMEVHIYSNKIYFKGTLLDPPPHMSFFKKVPGLHKKEMDGKVETKPVSNAEACAHACNSGTSCDGFQYCPSKTMCILQQGQASIGSTAPLKADCAFYTRIVRSPKSEVSMNMAWITLKNLVLDGNFKVILNIAGKSKSIIATSAVLDDLRADRLSTHPSEVKPVG